MQRGGCGEISSTLDICVFLLLPPFHACLNPSGALGHGVMLIVFVSHARRSADVCTLSHISVHVRQCVWKQSARAREGHVPPPRPLPPHSVALSAPELQVGLLIGAVSRTSIQTLRRPASSWPCSSVWVWSWCWMKRPPRPGEAGAVLRRS